MRQLRGGGAPTAAAAVLLLLALTTQGAGASSSSIIVGGVQQQGAAFQAPAGHVHRQRRAREEVLVVDIDDSPQRDEGKEDDYGEDAFEEDVSQQLERSAIGAAERSPCSPFLPGSSYE